MERQSFEASNRSAWKGVKDLTGSRVASIFGDHPYIKVDQLAYEFRHGAVKAQGNEEALRAGRILEPGIAIAIKEVHPEWTITKCTTYHRIPELRIGAIPDFWVDADTLIEAVTVSEDEWNRHPGPPKYKVWQCAAEMLVTGRSKGVVAVLVKDRAYTLPLHLFEVPNPEKYQAKIIEGVQKWWKALDRGRENAEFPLPYGHNADISALVASKVQKRPAQILGPVLRF